MQREEIYLLMFMAVRKTRKAAKKAKSKARVNKAATHRSAAKASKPRRASSKLGSKISYARAQKKAAKKETNIIPHEDAKKLIDAIMANEKIVDYLKKNVSKRALDVVNLLAYPRTDEYIADQLGLKVNAVRRILNIMQGYGVTNYHISKNNNGWLSFGWYINANKLPSFIEYVSEVTKENEVIDSNCNDYFICKKCFDSEKFVYTFDAAFEAGFKCKSCNAKLERVDRADVEALTRKPENAAKKPLEDISRV